MPEPNLKGFSEQPTPPTPPAHSQTNQTGRGFSVLRLTLLALLTAVVVWGIIVGEPAEEDRVSALSSRIRCPVCQGESILDSPAPYAQDILAFVKTRIADGWSDEQILDHLEERFTGIRLDPPFSGASLLLWLLPLAVAGLGIALMVRRIRKPSPPAKSSSQVS